MTPCPVILRNRNKLVVKVTVIATIRMTQLLYTYARPSFSSNAYLENFTPYIHAIL